jgi:hypothetical protein
LVATVKNERDSTGEQEEVYYLFAADNAVGLYTSGVVHSGQNEYIFPVLEKCGFTFWFMQALISGM